MTDDHNTRNRLSRERLARVATALGGRVLIVDQSWTAAALLGHLAFWDRFNAARLAKYVRDGKPPEFGTDAITDFINEAGLAQWAAIPPVDAAHQAIAATAATDAAIERLSAAQAAELRSLGRPRLLDRSGHRDEHLEAIERALG